MHVVLPREKCDEVPAIDRQDTQTFREGWVDGTVILDECGE